MQFVQRASVMALDHYIFFCTLTYNNESLPSITTSSGYTIHYADIKDVQNMVKRIRKSNSFGRPFKFAFVTERGTEKGRPHIHGLIFIPKYENDDKLFPSQLETSLRDVVFKEWRRNYGSNRNPIWKPLFTYHRKYVSGEIHTNFDLHFVTERSTPNGSVDVSYYVSKYLLKPSSKEIRLQQALRLNLPEDEYQDVWNLVKSRCLVSKFFGLSTDREREYVSSCLFRSQYEKDGLAIYDSQGFPRPLSKYYRKLVTKDIALTSSKYHPPVYEDTRDISSKLDSIARGKRLIEKIKSRDISETF